MRLKTLIKFFTWFVVFISVLNVSLEMISAANTIENIAGAFLLILTVYFSFKTKCLTSITLKQKNEK